VIDSAIVFKYTRAAPGREAKALDLFTEAMAFFGTSAHEGKCEEPLTFMGTSGQSLIIVPGEFDALTELTMSEEFRELYTKVVFAVPDVAYEFGPYGQGVQDYMARWARIGNELALI
jgi:hypothetical protein